MAIRAATFAMGYPVALDARADDRLTLGLTSMTLYSKLYGFKASCTLHPPFMLSAVTIFIEAFLNIWYSLSLSVCEGAMTMLSPVWMPTGSMFFMLHTVMQLPLLSRIISYSISFQPLTLFSIKTCPTAL